MTRRTVDAIGSSLTGAVVGALAVGGTLVEAWAVGIVVAVLFGAVFAWATRERKHADVDARARSRARGIR